MCFITLLLFGITMTAQVTPTDSSETSDTFVVTKNDGTEYIGTIISDDGREVLIDTKALGKIYLPKSDIKSIVKIEDANAIVHGEYQAAGPFTTRYAFTTNALPIVKGENYAMINLYGPEVHFAVTDNFSIGIMSSWIASPFILALKYSFKTSESKVNFSLGTLMGTSGYLNTFRGYGGLHWFNVTCGDRKNNITFSAGYAYFQAGNENRYAVPGIYHNIPPYEYTTELSPLTKGPVVSVAGICKVGAKASFIFDSMLGAFVRTETSETYNEITPASYDGGMYIPATYDYIVEDAETKETALFLMPGMRFQHTDNKAFQISLAGVTLFNDFIGVESFPFPMCSWFYKF